MDEIIYIDGIPVSDGKNVNLVVNPTTYNITSQDLVITFSCTGTVTVAQILINGTYETATSFTQNSATFKNNIFNTGKTTVSRLALIVNNAWAMWDSGIIVNKTDAVQDVLVSNIIVEPDNKIINIGDNFTLKHTIAPSNATNKAVIFSSSNENIATVNSNGLVTAKGKGLCDIICSAIDASNKKGICKVNVKEVIIHENKKEALKIAKDDYDKKHEALKKMINDLSIKDKINESDSMLLKTYFEAYNNALAALQKALQEARDSISQNKVDIAKEDLEKEVTIINSKVAEIKVDTDSIKQKVSNVENSVTTSNLNATEALKKAEEAKNKANTAQNNATDAQNKAEEANKLLGDIASDSKLTANEKQNTKKEWDIIVIEKSKIVDQANALAVNVAEYINRYNALNSYITPLLADLMVTSDINGTVFRSNFSTYYAEKQRVLDNINLKLKQLADKAKEDADKALDGVQKHEVRIKEAEQKITADAIKNTVSENFYTKDDVDKKDYATKSEVTQTANQVKFDFISSGGYNLLRNSAFGNKHIDKWWFWGDCSKCTDYSYYKNIGDMYIAATKIGGLWQSGIPIKPNAKYTLSVQCDFEPNVYDCKFILEYCTDEECNNVINTQEFILQNSPERQSITFTILNDNRIKWAKGGFRHSGTKNGQAKSYLIHINKPCFAEGVVAPWSPHPNEVINGNTIIDKDGVTINNGALNIQNNNGEKVLNGDSKGDLNLRGKFSCIRGNAGESTDIINGFVEFNILANETVEKVGRILPVRFSSDNTQNGLCISQAGEGDYVALTHNTEGSTTQSPFLVCRKDFHPNSTIWNHSGVSCYEDLNIIQGNIIALEVDQNNYWHKIFGSATDKLCLMGEQGLAFGFIWDRANYKTVLEIDDVDQNSSRLHIWGHADWHNWKLHNPNIVYTRVNPISRKLVEMHSVQSEENVLRKLFVDVQLSNGKAYVNIPNQYVGYKWEVSSLVKKGRGDIWIEEQSESKVIVQGENDIKFNIEFTIALPEIEPKMSKDRDNLEPKKRMDHSVDVLS